MFPRWCALISSLIIASVAAITENLSKAGDAAHDGELALVLDLERRLGEVLEVDRVLVGALPVAEQGGLAERPQPQRVHAADDHRAAEGGRRLGEVVPVALLDDVHVQAGTGAVLLDGADAPRGDVRLGRREPAERERAHAAQEDRRRERDADVAVAPE